MERQSPWRTFSRSRPSARCSPALLVPSALGTHWENGWPVQSAASARAALSRSSPLPSRRSQVNRLSSQCAGDSSADSRIMRLSESLANKNSSTVSSFLQSAALFFLSYIFCILKRTTFTTVIAKDFGGLLPDMWCEIKCSSGVR